MTDITVVAIAAVLTLMIYTILYRENPAFRLAEHILVGATVGNAVVQAVFQIQNLAITKFSKGMETGDVIGILYIFSIILGILLYFQFSSKYRYISKISIALMLAVGLSLSMRGLISVNVIGQIIGAMQPLNSVQNIVYLIGVVCVLLYFVYEKKASNISGPLPKIGRYILMMTMGAYFANVLMGRVSLVIGSLTDLFVAPAYYFIPIALLIIIADALTRKKAAEKKS
jgi:uncharacterized membrane protein YuzA (DUF378 family)